MKISKATTFLGKLVQTMSGKQMKGTQFFPHPFLSMGGITRVSRSKTSIIKRYSFRP